MSLLCRIFLGRILVNWEGKCVDNSKSGKGLLLATGDLPEGVASAMRIRLLAAALHEGGIPIEIGLVHPTLKYPVPENNALSGTLSGVHYTYLNGRIVRPATITGAIRDTLSGILSATRLILAKGGRKPAFVIFYTPTYWEMIVPMLVARYRGIPVFVEACEIWSAIAAFERLGTVRRLVESGNRLFERLIPRWARGVIAISTSISDFYKKRGMRNENIFLLPILVDVKNYKKQSDDIVPNLKGVSYFLNSGTFSAKDGVTYLLQAFAQIAREFPDVHLAFTGNISEQIRRELFRVLPDETTRQRICFVGFLRREELAWAYQNANALLSCRPSNAFANYGLPTKLAEYLASGTAVIATRVGDVERYLTDSENAYLAQPENPYSIAECMRRILRDPQAARRAGERGQKTAIKYFSYKSYSLPLSEFIRQRVLQ